MLKNKLNYVIINLAALMLLLYIGVTNIGIWWGVVLKCISLLSPFIIGFLFAYAFYPLANWLEKNGINRKIGIALIVIVPVLIVILLGAVLIPMLYDQLSLFIKMIAEVANNFSDKFNINLGSFQIRITDYLNQILKDLGSVASSTAAGILTKSIGFIGKFVVGFVGYIYFLIDMDKIRRGFKELLNSIGKRWLEYFDMMDKEITNYLKGLELFMFIQLLEYSLLFLLVGHPNWLILGILACITTIIPYFGGLITNILAIIMASVVSTRLVILTTLICLIFPQLDGYVISPKVYGKTNNANPLITIMAVSVGGTLAGPIGIIIALPVYLLIRNSYHFFKKDLKKGMVQIKKNI